MTLTRRRFLHLAAAAAFPAVSGFAWAQGYPTQPVRLIVTTAAGGTQDSLARLIGQKLSERLGKPFFIESRPGGGPNIGTEAFVRGPGGGETLLLVSPAEPRKATTFGQLQFK